MTVPESPFNDEEDAPLLPDVGSSYVGTCSLSYLPFYQTRSRILITLVAFLIIFILAFGGYLMAVPSIRLYEDIICHHYYNELQGDGHIGFEGQIDEELCKVEEVQEELNILLAGLHFLGALPPLLTAVPYGLLADRIGRRPVFVMAMFGLFLASGWSFMVMRFWRTLHYRLLWLSPGFTLFGGGEVVGSMMFYAIGSDVTPQAKRANVFLMGGGCTLLAEILAPSMASILMAKSPWIPLIIGVSTFIFGPALFIFVPETLHMQPRASESATLTPDAASKRSAEINDDNKQGFFASITAQSRKSLKEVYSSLSMSLSFPILLLLLAFVIQPFTRQSVDLSVRYVSNRFHWKLRQAGFLLSLRALINFVLLLALLPGLSHYLLRQLHFSSTEKDLLLARISVVVLVIGALLIAISPTITLTILGMVVFTLGTGTVALTRSLVTSLVDQEHVGRLYAAIGLVETCGGLAAGPVLAALYTTGLRLQGHWVGLPFFALSIICFVGAIGLWTFGCLTPKHIRDRMSSDEEHVDEYTSLVLPDSAEGGAINVV